MTIPKETLPLLRFKADTAWIRAEDDLPLLGQEIDRWMVEKALLTGDLAAGDGDPTILQNGIDYAEEVLKQLLRQLARIERAVGPLPARPPVHLDEIRARMAAANALDTFEVLDRVTGSWSRLGPRDEYWLCCPLKGHEEKTASFHMNTDGRWWCFGCHRGGGDKVSFVASWLEASQMDGLRYLERLFQLGEWE